MKRLAKLPLIMLYWPCIVWVGMWLFLSCRDIHTVIKVPDNVGHEYGWELPGMVAMFTIIPMLIGYVTGRVAEYRARGSR